MVLWIKSRADYRCECGTFWACDLAHAGRCRNREGMLSQSTKREVKLRVVQLGDENCWDPDTLIALCKQCHEDYERKKASREQDLTRVIEQQCDPLFDIAPAAPKHITIREQN
jgi:hypothetical protein